MYLSMFYLPSFVATCILNFIHEPPQVYHRFCSAKYILHTLSMDIWSLKK